MRSIHIILLIIVLMGNVAKAQQHIAGQVLVQSSLPIDTLLSQFNTSAKAKVLQRKLFCASPVLNIWLIQYDESYKTEQAFLSELKNFRGVQVAQWNHPIEWRDVLTDDPLLPQQWQWDNNGSTGGLNDADVDADLAWDYANGDLTADGDKIVIAIVDDGTSSFCYDVWINHWMNNQEIPDDNFDNDGNGYIDDYLGWNVESSNDNVLNGGHGVAVSAMAAARGNNGIGGTGIAPQASIMNIVVGEQDEAHAIAAYTYIYQMRHLYNTTHGEKGAFVVTSNSSWGLNGVWASEAPLWCNMYDLMGSVGIISCVATSNLGTNIGVTGDLPSTCASEFLIVSTASDNHDNFEGSYSPEFVDVAAPGVDVLTATQSGDYATYSGTSFASPVVAGLVALMYSVPCNNVATHAKLFPDSMALAIKQHIYNALDVLPQLQGIVSTGGRINAHKAVLNMINQGEVCPPPSTIMLAFTEPSSVTVSWTNCGIGLVNIRYRKVGTTIWEQLDFQPNNSDISNLEPCQEYEFQLQSLCDIGISDYSASKFIHTEGCCESPNFMPLTQVQNSSFDIQWAATMVADSCQMRYKKAGDSDWTYSQFQYLTNSGYTNIMCEPCQEYLLQMRSICNEAYSEWSDTTQFTSLGCGACKDAAYCQSQGASTEYEWIESFSIGEYLIQSGNNYGYADLSPSDYTIDLTMGEDVLITMTPGFSDILFSEYFKIWIDYNADGIFDENTEVLLDAGTTNITMSAWATIPILDEEVLATRMRVAMSYSTFGITPEPCDFIQYGEVEDYCVNLKLVTSQVAPSPDSKSITLFPNPSKESLHFKQLNSSQQYNYEIYNAQGILIQQADLQNNTVDIQRLNDGMYYIILKNNTTQTSFSFLKTS